MPPAACSLIAQLAAAVRIGGYGLFAETQPMVTPQIATYKVGYLKAEHLLVYTRGEVKDLLIQGRMRLAADGDAEVLDAFWNPELVQMEKSLAVAGLRGFNDDRRHPKPRNGEDDL
jgi:hypothetical protein